MCRTEAWKLQTTISKHDWGLVLKYSHCTLPCFLLSLSSSKNPRAASGLHVEGRFGHLQRGSIISAVLSRELHTHHTAVHGWTTRKCLEGYFNATLCSRGTAESRLHWGATGPSTSLFARAEQSSLLANHTQRSITSFYSTVPGKEQSHKKQKPQGQLPSPHRSRKSNPNLCGPAGTSQSQALLSGAFPPPLGTALWYRSEVNWTMQEAPQYCWWARG